ncbi:glycerate kinase-like [Watersipora subatra]|uniref:glycerate kinase-like n=1 Tax=Watersipora subatra TaxID=2589382 RepID=UPI00355ADB89
MVKAISQAAIKSVQPIQMVQNNLELKGELLKVGKGNQQQVIDLTQKRCHVVAYGKAVVGMVAAVHSILGEKIVSGIASIPTNIQKALIANGAQDLLPGPDSVVQLCEGAYMNIPDEACLNTSIQIEELICQLSAQDLLITLTSGGGSALLCLPIPPLTLDIMADTTRGLAKAGANIVELNTVRKHLEILKGGGLASLAHPARVVNLILSDIVGDPIDCIASGPTVTDTSTSADAIDILEKYLTSQQIHPVVMDVLKRDLKSEMIRPQAEVAQVDPLNIVIGSNSIALEAAVQACHDHKILSVLITSSLCGEAQQVGRDMAELARRILQGVGDTHYLEGLFGDTLDMSTEMKTSLEKELQAEVQKSKKDNTPLCLLFGGETTVHVMGSGKGGRNQEMCLSALISMEEFSLPDDKVVFCSLGTDGQDGPTDAAGACITPQCMLGNSLNARLSLSNNDSYTYFSELHEGKNLLRTGLTGTNVMDISILLVRP